LNIATHAHYYSGGHPERNELQMALAAHPEWVAYRQHCEPLMVSQQSTIFVEAHSIMDQFHNQVPGLAVAQVVDNDDDNKESSNPSILELRRYQLKLGYDTVPRFLDLYGQGLPSKLATLHPGTCLVTVLYSDVGRLNEVIEIWKHSGGTFAMEQSRQAARTATEWKRAIAQIANLAVEFQTTIHKPTSFSPL